jgi:hypothetical protein
MSHEPRQRRSWLIFDVGQKMTALRRYLAPSILAGAIFVVPYAFPIAVSLALIAGAPHDHPRTLQSIVAISFVVGLILDVLMCLVPAIFFSIARQSWTSEDKIVPEHLFGWPIGIAVVAGISTCGFLMQGAFSLSPAWIIAISVLMTVFAAGCGLLAAFVWRRMTYRA